MPLRKNYVRDIFIAAMHVVSKCHIRHIKFVIQREHRDANLLFLISPFWQ